MPVRETVIESLIRDEGLELKPYRDSVGKLTIGIGRNLDDKGISESEARMLLANDVDDAWRGLGQQLPMVDHRAGTRASSPVEPMLQSGMAEVVNVQEDARRAGEGRLPRRRGRG